MLNRRVDSFNASLLPYQKPEHIREELDALRAEMMEFDVTDNIADTEKDNAVLIKERRAHAAKVLAKRKAAGKPKKKLKAPSKARRIR